jgi:homoserine kinase type II
MKRVFLLWHTHLKSDGEEDDKLIGVYESQEAAQSAIDRVGSQPGFIDHPSGFQIEPHTIGVDGWTEGFVKVTSKLE